MLEKVVGAMAAGVCFLLGGFLALAALFALLDGEESAQLYALGAAGVGLVFGGFFLLGRLGRRRVVKRASVDDESW